jgi:hypothetical protein
MGKLNDKEFMKFIKGLKKEAKFCMAESNRLMSKWHKINVQLDKHNSRIVEIEHASYLKKKNKKKKS